jgi:hypothetical protein
MAVGLLCLLLAACGRELVWAEVGTSVVDLEKAAGDAVELPPFDPAPFRIPVPEEIRPLAWLDGETALCLKKEAGRTDLTALTVDGEETLLEENVDPALQAVAQEGSVAYGRTEEEADLTFARWDGAALTPLYQFQDTGVPGFARCFTPDGALAAFSWNRAAPSKDWTVRVVDMKTGKTQDLIPPVWDTASAYIRLFVHWTDDETLQVIARAGTGAFARFSAWECKL